MTVDEARNVKVGDNLVYIADDFNGNEIELYICVTNIWYDKQDNPSFFTVDIVDDKGTKTVNADAPIRCFKFN